MEIIWNYIYFYIILNIVKICNGFPINNLSTLGWNEQSITLLAVAVAICAISLFIGCVCCQRRPGFKEFRDSPVSASVVTEDDPGHVNPIAGSEFTIFTPLSPPHHNNNVFRSSQPRQPIQSGSETPKVQIEGVDLNSWFDGSRLEFSRNKLKYIRELGSGWFGRVVEGEAEDIVEENVWTPVAVRILETTASAHEQAIFLNEASIYKLEPHPNVLQLLGHSLEAAPLLLIQEYCSRGDLKKFLLETASSANSPVGVNLPLKFSCQLASALQYLHQNDLPHLDLAARTCQLKPDLTLKLGDYGTAVTQYPQDYYQGVPAIPVRWCAPETIYYTNTTLQPKSTTKKSNIWSLGVTLWEICEWGTQPYNWLTDDEVISQVLGPANVRLGRPEKTNGFYIDHMYKLMRLCWDSEENRPNIQQIYNMLVHLLQVSNNNTPSKTLDFSSEDFDSRWESFKPNTIVKTDNQIDTDLLTVEKIDRSSISSNEYQNENNENKKSPSLTNLHGSFENIANEKSIKENTDPFDTDISNSKVTENLEKTHPEMDSWLQNVAMDTKDMSYVRNLGEVIHDLDSALASEPTSSSSMISYQENWTSPEKRKIDFKIGEPIGLGKISGRSLDDSGSIMDSICYPKNESGSETEDETWKKRIERGAYSEKVRQKSKSVTDLMVLTHIDPSESDSETPLQSLDFKPNFPYKNVRYSGGMDNSLIYGSEGNLLEIQDTFQEELKKLQEERKDSLLFVPVRSSSQDNENSKENIQDSAKQAIQKTNPFEKSENFGKTNPFEKNDTLDKSNPFEKSDPFEKLDPFEKMFPPEKSDPFMKSVQSEKSDILEKRDPFEKTDFSVSKSDISPETKPISSKFENVTQKVANFLQHEKSFDQSDLSDSKKAQFGDRSKSEARGEDIFGEILQTKPNFEENPKFEARNRTLETALSEEMALNEPIGALGEEIAKNRPEMALSEEIFKNKTELALSEKLVLSEEMPHEDTKIVSSEELPKKEAKMDLFEDNFEARKASKTELPESNLTQMNIPVEQILQNKPEMALSEENAQNEDKKDPFEENLSQRVPKIDLPGSNLTQTDFQIEENVQIGELLKNEEIKSATEEKSSLIEAKNLQFEEFRPQIEESKILFEERTREKVVDFLENERKFSEKNPILIGNTPQVEEMLRKSEYLSKIEAKPSITEIEQSSKSEEMSSKSEETSSLSEEMFLKTEERSSKCEEISSPTEERSSIEDPKEKSSHEKVSCDESAKNVLSFLENERKVSSEDQLDPIEERSSIFNLDYNEDTNTFVLNRTQIPQITLDLIPDDNLDKISICSDENLVDLEDIKLSLKEEILPACEELQNFEEISLENSDNEEKLTDLVNVASGPILEKSSSEESKGSSIKIEEIEVTNAEFDYQIEKSNIRIHVSQFESEDRPNFETSFSFDEENIDPIEETDQKSTENVKEMATSSSDTSKNQHKVTKEAENTQTASVNEEIGLKNEDFGPKNEDFGLKNEDFGPKNEDFSYKNKEFDLKLEDFDVKSEEISSEKKAIIPQIEEMKTSFEEKAQKVVDFLENERKFAEKDPILITNRPQVEEMLQKIEEKSSKTEESLFEPEDSGVKETLEKTEEIASGMEEKSSIIGEKSSEIEDKSSKIKEISSKTEEILKVEQTEEKCNEQTAPVIEHESSKIEEKSSKIEEKSLKPEKSSSKINQTFDFLENERKFAEKDPILLKNRPQVEELLQKIEDTKLTEEKISSKINQTFDFLENERKFAEKDPILLKNRSEVEEMLEIIEDPKPTEEISSQKYLDKNEKNQKKTFEEKYSDVPTASALEFIKIDDTLISTVKDFINAEKMDSEGPDPKTLKKKSNLTSVTQSHSFIDYNTLQDPKNVKPQIYNVFNVTIDHGTPDFLGFNDPILSPSSKNAVCTSSLQKDLPDFQNKPLNGFVNEKPVFTSTPFIKKTKSQFKTFENGERIDNESSVILGPCEDYTLGLYSGLKTTFDKYSDVPEEELLQFSSNFMPLDPSNISPNLDLSLETWDKCLEKTLVDNQKLYDNSPRLESLKLDDSFYVGASQSNEKPNENLDNGNENFDDKISNEEPQLLSKNNEKIKNVDFKSEKQDNKIKKRYFADPCDKNGSANTRIDNDRPKRRYFDEIYFDEPQNGTFIKSETGFEGPQNENFVQNMPQNETFVQNRPQNDTFVQNEIFNDKPQNETFVNERPQNQTFVQDEPKNEIFGAKIEKLDQNRPLNETFDAKLAQDATFVQNRSITNFDEKDLKNEKLVENVHKENILSKNERDILVGQSLSETFVQNLDETENRLQNVTFVQKRDENIDNTKFVDDETYDISQDSNSKELDGELIFDESFDRGFENSNRSNSDSIFNEFLTSKKNSDECVLNSWEPGEGWFLHPQTPVEGEMEFQDDSKSQSYVGFTLDEESVNALRNELAAKLPNAMGQNQELDDFDELTDDSNEERDEIIVKYNVYATPLSPIPEESCCDDMFCDQTQHNDGSDTDSNFDDNELDRSKLESPLVIDTDTHTALILDSPSAKCAQNPHTPSQDSCCSNDTLFNVEDINLIDPEIQTLQIAEPKMEPKEEILNDNDSDKTLQEDIPVTKSTEIEMNPQEGGSGTQEPERNPQEIGSRTQYVERIPQEEDMETQEVESRTQMEKGTQGLVLGSNEPIVVDTEPKISETVPNLTEKEDFSEAPGTQNVVPKILDTNPEPQNKIQEDPVLENPNLDLTEGSPGTSPKINTQENLVPQNQTVTEQFHKENLTLEERTQSTTPKMSPENLNLQIQTDDTHQTNKDTRTQIYSGTKNTLEPEGSLDEKSKVRSENQELTYNEENKNEKEVLEQKMDTKDTQNSLGTQGSSKTENTLESSSKMSRPENLEFSEIKTSESGSNVYQTDLEGIKGSQNPEILEISPDDETNTNTTSTTTTEKSTLRLNLAPLPQNVVHLPSPEEIPWKQLPASLLSYSQVALEPAENHETIDSDNEDNSENLKEFENDDYFEMEDNVPEEFSNEDSSNNVYLNLMDIRFSGPGDNQIMSTSFSESANDLDNEKDWDSGSDTRSSSSGEFIWKEGEHEESVRALNHDQERQEPISSPMEVIAEENSETSEDDDDDDEDEIEETEFVPSAWDSQATPTKSALRSPEKSNKQKSQKGVSFKKEKYHCVYEYPREPESPITQTSDLWRPLADFSNYAELWDLDPDSCLPMEDDNNVYESRRFPPRDYYQISNNSSKLRDFYQMNTYPDFTSGRDLFNENITPDSGIDDVTPGSLSESTSLDFQKLREIPSLKTLASLAANKTEVIQKDVLGGLRHTRNRLKLDLPPSPSSFTTNKTFNIDFNTDPLNRETPTFTTFGKSRFSVQHVETPTEDSLTTAPSKNVSFEALPYNPSSKNFITPENYTNFEAKEINAPLNLNEIEKLESDLSPVLVTASLKGPLEANLSNLTSLSNDPNEIVSTDFKSNIETNSSLVNLALSSRNLSKLPLKSDSLNSDDITDEPTKSDLNDELVNDSLNAAVLNPNDTLNKVSLKQIEVVRGEASLLDSADEDSGIESSTNATLERQMSN